jgi:hypothetical protein
MTDGPESFTRLVDLSQPPETCHQQSTERVLGPRVMLARPQAP